MSIIEDKGIEFYNETINGRIYKYATTEQYSDIHHITEFTDVNTIQSMIDNINLAINGNYSSIVYKDISNEIQLAFIKENEIEFWDQQCTNLLGTCGLQEFKELCIAWLNFLNTPPYHGTKV